MVYCSNCGKQLQDGTNTCLHCNFQNSIPPMLQTQQIAISVQNENQPVGYMKWLETKAWASILGMMALLIGLMGLVLFLFGLSSESYPVCSGGCGLLMLGLFLRSKERYYNEQVVLMK